MTASVPLEQSQSKHKMVHKRLFISFDTANLVCKFSGKSPLSSHKTTTNGNRRNGQKRWKIKEKTSYLGICQ